MIPLKRLDEPRVLAENKDKWLTAYRAELAATPKKRPHSAKYAHKEIKSTLEAMSFHKCFYCEQSTKQSTPEVDHYIEVAEQPDLAFKWENLYLSCQGCNDKLPNRSVPVTDCLDPCDPSTQPADHLTFTDEFISARSGSTRGQQTIRKYKLDRPDLDHKRGRQLRVFNETLLQIKDNQIAAGGRAMTEGEKDLLRRFKQPDYPFSLMFTVYLQGKSI